MRPSSCVQADTQAIQSLGPGDFQLRLTFQETNVVLFPQAPSTALWIPHSMAWCNSLRHTSRRFTCQIKGWWLLQTRNQYCNPPL